MTTYRDIMNECTQESLPTLDVAVLGALELFIEETLPQAPVRELFAHPLVVGSGNAEVTGKVIFSGTNALFASESTAKETLEGNKQIDGVVIISASGEKHAPVLVKLAKEYGKQVALLTNTASSTASSLLDDTDHEFVFPKNREPYTYNTSTYMGMMLAATGEDPKRILEVIQEIEKLELPDFAARDKFFMVLPAHFAPLCRMFQIKFIELFGRRIARDVETEEYMKHAATVIPSDELFVNLGLKSPTWGDAENTLYVPVPEDAGFATMMAIGYVIIGKMQQAHPFFKDEIAGYIERANAALGSDLRVIT